MLGREQKAQLPIAAKRHIAPAKKIPGTAPWAVAAGNGTSEADGRVGPGRCLAAPTGPSRSPPALQVPRATSRTSAAQNDRPGAHTTPDLAAMAAPPPPPACLVHPPIGTLSPTHEPQRPQGALAVPQGHVRWCGGLGAAQGAL